MEWAYFLDIDGTVLEIAPFPDQIFVDHDLRSLIEQLHARTGGAVALITGRSIEDVDRVFPMDGMPVAGQHGLEVRDARGQITSHPARADSLDQLRLALIDTVTRHPGLHVEFKGLTIALHYRAAPRLASYAHRLMKGLHARFVPDFVLQAGKRVVELKPAGRDKGVAIRELMEGAPFAGRLPVFLGDDATDEFGFEVVNQLGGHSIKVGKGRTCARWHLADVESVREWLRLGFDAATNYQRDSMMEDG